MDPTFDDQIDQLHRQLEAKERDARMAEQRLRGLKLPVGSLKARSYGELPQVEGLTARAMVARLDPPLATLLGLPVPRPSYEQQEADLCRQAQVQRLQRATEEARQRNQQAHQHREHAAIAGVNPLLNRRLGQ